MWWNFVGRTHEDVVRARQAWREGPDRCGQVYGDGGERLPAPESPHATPTPRRAPASRAPRPTDRGLSQLPRSSGL
ncbi:hypothetical protein SAM23877_0477 [Streptomyces ambofaciens ATCC 23877]|uniref:Pirin n=1 Tax=Streptomyces ambofaciens (strain ATCC 23877 / 3486 / DSM 40053 / JCM 4204 / NBRC 12836 / NRRL B-2516) TaxID=278992 RepID=A0A0K2AKV0_STRA7|nr:hypothetical protein SAM23877_0477 [Streptomyces ambofaciens ATCC 23877]